ncbi:MAG: DegT/DnrJ/EryC1/StrS family aminotransferase [Fuerstiella sp.]
MKTTLNNADSSCRSHSECDRTLRQHLLTVNVEDYFQVGVFQKFISADNWYRFESRLQQNVEHVLELLEQHQTVATFFVLGWIAEKHPQLVRTILNGGHELASRGYLHQPLLTLSRPQIREDLQRSKAVLEDISGQAVDGFRLSDGWLDKETLWLLEELAAAGYRYDSSLMPRQRDFADQPEWRQIRNVQTAGGPLLEIPLTTMELPVGWMPIAGGNYQRQVPDFLMRRLVDRVVMSDRDPFVMYFQVWELDEQQPQLSVADRMTRLRHYRKLGKYRRILPQYLKRYAFTSIRDHALLDSSPLSALADGRRTAPDRHTVAASGCPGQHSADSDVESGTAAASSALVTATPARTGSSSTGPSNAGSANIGTANIGSANTSSANTDSATGKVVSSQAATQTFDSGTPGTQKSAVTVVIPCFNEEKSLAYLANTLSSVTARLAEHWQPRILFVDDCSTDNTFAALQDQFGDDPDIRIVRHEVNRGVSAAIRTGIEHAETEVVASMDCDCSYDPHELAGMLPLLTDDVSMVTASPYHRDGLVRNVPGWRLILSRGLSAMYQRLLTHSLATWTSCFRVYRRSHILDLPLHEDGFLGTAELAAQLVLHQRRVAEYPATLEVRLFGLSKMKTIRAILSHLRLLARIAVTSRGGLQNTIVNTGSDEPAEQQSAESGNGPRAQDRFEDNSTSPPTSERTETMQLPSDQDSTGRTLGAEELELLRQVIDSGTLTSTKGQFVRQLETEFAKKLGSRHAFACASGTAAIHCAVAAINPEPGDEIITTSITDMGGLTPIIYQGAIPVFADVDPATYNVTARSIEKVISERTRAIIVTHLFGNPCEMAAIQELAKRHNIPVIEDCAQAFLSTYQDRHVGTIGDIGCFSLQQGKHITTGEGGLVVTNDDALARHMFLYINKAWGYGDEKPDHYFAALNYRMSELQGAVAVAQLEKLENVVASRVRLAEALTTRLSGVAGITTPEITPNSLHTYWKYCLNVDAGVIEGGSPGLGAELRKLGIACAPRYIQKPAFECQVIRDQVTFGSSRWPFTLARPEAVDYSRERFTGTYEALQQVLVLPFNECYTDEHIEFLAASIREAAGSLRKTTAHRVSV